MYYKSVLRSFYDVIPLIKRIKGKFTVLEKLVQIKVSLCAREVKTRRAYFGIKKGKFHERL